ncbi:MAG TPA: trypsin-like peptidase domain-containing protein, partial [Dehalococcoidia bacterium]
QSPPPPVWLALALAVGLLAGAISGAAVAFLNDSDGGGGGTAVAPSGEAGADRVAQVAARAVSSVVAIINEYEAQGDEPAGTAGGAGVIIDERGYILTNAHIVLLPGTLFVILNDGSVRPATVVSHDAPFTDVAVVQMQGGGLQALDVGDSAELSLGQTVIAIGSPDIDYFNSVTVGVVSGLQRRKQLGNVWLEDLIQTDAAINVGNSGGPLVDLNGQVVGLNTFRDEGGGPDPLFGISFAIPSRTFGPIADAMIRTGEFPRPYFGVEHTDLTEETATAKGLKADAQGAYLESVLADGPASAAGLRAGDIVTKIGQFDVTTAFTLLSALGQTQPSANVDVTILRNNQPMTLKVQLRPR